MSNLNNMVVHCPEYWMFKEVMRICKANIEDWDGGFADRWHYYKDETGIYINCKNWEYSPISFYERKGYTILSFDQFKKQFMNDQKTTEERTVSVSLSTAKEWYKKGGVLKKVALQAYSKEDLKEKEVLTWEDYDKYASAFICKTPKQIKSIEAYEKILLLMDVYNEAWKADWSNGMEVKFVVSSSYGRIYSSVSTVYDSPIYFKSPELRDKFLANNEQLLKDYFMID